jgi:alanyl-tRNA synthetase
LNPQELELIEQKVNNQIREANSLIEERNIPMEIAKKKREQLCYLGKSMVIQ